MNSKKAKALRRVLKNLQAQQNPTDQALPQVAYSENKQNRKMISVEDLDEEGNTVTKNIPIAAGTVTVEKRSVRGLYKHLKKTMSNPQIGEPIKQVQPALVQQTKFIEDDLPPPII